MMFSFAILAILALSNASTIRKESSDYNPKVIKVVNFIVSEADAGISKMLDEAAHELSVNISPEALDKLSKESKNVDANKRYYGYGYGYPPYSYGYGYPYGGYYGGYYGYYGGYYGGYGGYYYKRSETTDSKINHRHQTTFEQIRNDLEIHHKRAMNEFRKSALQIINTEYEESQLKSSRMHKRANTEGYISAVRESALKVQTALKKSFRIIIEKGLKPMLGFFKRIKNQASIMSKEIFTTEISVKTRDIIAAAIALPFVAFLLFELFNGRD